MIVFLKYPQLQRADEISKSNSTQREEEHLPSNGTVGIYIKKLELSLEGLAGIE